LSDTVKPSGCQGCELFAAPMASGYVGSNSPTVLFLFGRPAAWDDRIVGRSFSDRATRILKKILEDLKLEEHQQPPIGQFGTPMRDAFNNKAFLYAVQCAKSGPAPSKRTIDHCASAYTHHVIGQLKPRVIVALGNIAFKCLGLPGGVKSLRGSTVSVNIEGVTIPVIPTVSPVALLKREDAGLYMVIKNDVARAAREAAGITANLDMAKLAEGYHVPQTIVELAVVAERYASYVDPGKSIDNTIMALDTETNTLIPWLQGSRVIMLSASVDTGDACAIMLDHREAMYPWEEALPYVLKITMSPHPKAWWNYKFDLQMFMCSLMPKLRALCEDPKYKRNLEKIVGKTLEEILAVHGINNTRWDGLLGEHLLDEDKKGYYGLKVVVSDYLPEFSGYEKELDNQFEEASKATVTDEMASLLAPLPGLPLGMEWEPDPLLPVNDVLPFSNLRVLAESEMGFFSDLRKGMTRKRFPHLSGPAVRTRKVALSAKTKELTRIYREEKKTQKMYLRMLREYERSFKAELARRKNKGESTEATYEDIDPPILSVYAAIDADVTKRICRMQRIRAYKEDREEAAAEGRHALITLMRRHYLPLTEALAEIQAEGVWVDREYLREMGTQLDAETERLHIVIRQRLLDEVGLPLETELLLNSPEAVGNVLNGMYGLPVLKRTDKGQPSMTEAVMLEYVESGAEIAGEILTWKKLGKARNTYIKSYLAMSELDGRIHGRISINGTATGRSSSSDPNLQNVPHMLGRVNIKKTFVPTPLHTTAWWDSEANKVTALKYDWQPDDRLVWVDVDFAGAEVRVLCRYAQDPALLSALNAGQDMHSWMTAEIHGLEYEYVNRERKIAKSAMDKLRGATKRVVFGTIYGAGAEKIGEQIGVDEAEAQAIIDKLMNRFPQIKQYIAATHKIIAKKGRVVTPYGRFRRFPMANIGRWMKGRNDRQGVNFLIQSYCSDIVMSCLVNMNKHRRDICSRVLLTVHDSICFEMPVRMLPALKAFLQLRVDEHISRAFPDMPVAMPYDIDVGFSYGEKMGMDRFMAQVSA
jgi:DNA polymerase I-like protein with 3'-5' exonuclease and polymerase domains/uracil-DNA glycosylase